PQVPASRPIRRATSQPDTPSFAYPLRNPSKWRIPRMAFVQVFQPHETRLVGVVRGARCGGLSRLSTDGGGCGAVIAGAMGAGSDSMPVAGLRCCGGCASRHLRVSVCYSDVVGESCGCLCEL